MVFILYPDFLLTIPLINLKNAFGFSFLAVNLAWHRVIKIVVEVIFVKLISTQKTVNILPESEVILDHTSLTMNL